MLLNLILIKILFALVTIFGTCLPIAAAEEIDFFVNTVVPAGPNKGNPLDTKTRRTIVDISSTELGESYKEDPDDLILGNFFHNGKHFIIRIKNESVTETTVLMERFALFIGHSQLMYEFSQPVKLLAVIENDETLEQGYRVVDLENEIPLWELIYSIEATPFKDGPGFGIVSGLMGKLTIAIRMMSIQGRMKNSMIKHKLDVRSYLTNFLPSEGWMSLMAGIDGAPTSGMSVLYHIFRKNCMRAVYDALTRSRPFIREGHGYARRFINSARAIINYLSPLSKSLPFMTRFGLAWRGYLKKGISFYDNPVFLRWLNAEGTDLVEEAPPPSSSKLGERVQDCAEQLSK